MKYPEYEKDLQRIHESEVYGAAVFKTAGDLTFNAEKKKKWQRLKVLEDQTLARYLSYMKETNQTVTHPTGWDLKGHAEGAVLGLMPWSMAMKQLADATQPFQVVFQRLTQNATEDIDRKFFAYVLAHEKAIEFFAQREMAGDQNSLRAVENLLD